MAKSVETLSVPSLPRIVRVADAVAVVLLACAALPAVFHGGVVLRFRDLRVLSLTSAARPLIAALVVIAIRHAMFRADNLWLRLTSGARLSWSTWPPTPRARRQMCVAALSLFLLVLAGQAAPVRTGDGAEYMAMARNLARLHPPSLTPGEIVDLKRPFWDDNASYPQIIATTIEGPDGRRDFVHFWLYSLFAAPFVGLAQLVGIHPNYGFLAFNLVAVVVAAIALVPRIGIPATVLITTGPLVWWIDKAHTEIFVFAGLSIALALLSAMPAMSVVVLGVLVAQAPALAPIAVLIGVWAAIRGGARDKRFWAGALVAIAIVSLHPLYYWMRLGRLSPMTQVAARQWPGWAVLTACMSDPNIGLLPNDPALTLALVGTVIVFAIRAPRRFLSADTALVVATVAAALFAFSQTTNFNHGATVSVSRYGIWSIPLAVPLFGQIRECSMKGWAGAWLAALAAVSVVWAVAVYPPWRPGDYLTATPLANVLWTKAPSLNNPLPEIFCERTEHSEFHSLPATTRGCEKILTVGDGATAVWPSTCPPMEVPAECRVRDALCYANRNRDGYTFVGAPKQPGFDWLVNQQQAGRDR